MADGQIVFNMRWQGQEVRNVMTWSPIPDDLGDMQTLADNIRLTYAVNIGVASMTNSWQLYSLTFVFNDSAPVFSIEIPFTLGPLVGTHTGDPAPSQIALLATLKAIGAPPNRGRIYFSGLAEAQLVGGLWNTATTDLFFDLVDTWANGVNNGTGESFLRIGRKDASGILVSSNPVDSIILQPIPATQRRRRRGVGS